MKLKLVMCIKTFRMIEINLTTVIIQKMKLQAFQSQNSSVCDLKCIHTSKTITRAEKQLRESRRILLRRILNMKTTEKRYFITNNVSYNENDQKQLT